MRTAAGMRIGLVVIGVVLLAGLGGCPVSNTGTPATGTTGNGTSGTGTGGPGTGSSNATTHTVNIQGFAFSANSITIKKGDTVRWDNLDSAPHTVTSGNPGETTAGQVFDSGTLGPGQSFSHTFSTAGQFIYFCRFHGPTMASMRGAMVIVQ